MILRRKTITKDGLLEVWMQHIHRAALKDTLILFGIMIIVAIVLYLLFK